jgi:serpin B
MKKLTFLIIISMVMFSACDKSTPNDNETPSTPPLKIAADPTLVAEGNAFAFKLFATANSQNPNDENMVLSPLSLNMALAMVWNGANGETRDAIRIAMGMGDYADESVNDFFKTIRIGFASTDPNTKLSLANSIWYRPEFPVKQPFIDLNLQYYNALVRQLDFSLPTAAGTINQWCSDNTNGLIDNIIDDPISGDMAMFLINALYFKGMWKDSLAFNPEHTRNLSFYKSETEMTNVQTMFQHATVNTYQDENLQLITLPYGNGAFAMTVILPAYNTTFDDLLSTLQQDGYWHNCLTNRCLSGLDIYVPKFKVRYDTEEKLMPILTALGMGVAFDEYQADFSRLSDIPTFIGLVKQKTYIDVNEEGTEAAAVTIIGNMETSMPPSFVANRPFLFVIHETSTDVVLFMGKINNPQY